MELCQILSLHPKPIISSAFSPLSFLAAAAALQNSRELVSHRLVQSGPRAESTKQNTTVVYFNQPVLVEESSFSLVLCSIYHQSSAKVFHSTPLVGRAWCVFPAHIK